MNIKSKFNWGWGIAIFYSLFLLLVLIKLIFIFDLEYFLVSDDYYQEGVEYQEQIDKVKRTSKIENPVMWNYNLSSQTVQFNYPIDISSGKIVFYRPSNSNLDKYVKIDADENNQQTVNVQKWQKGFWKIKVDWEMNGELYYNEGSIDIN